MEERVVNVPLAAGINQEDDQFSVSPPEMESLINVQAVKKGALDTRMGFNLLTAAPVNYGPATSFSDTSGSTATVSEKIEALGPYTGATGSRPLLVSNGTLFDYVGSDGVHGWRQINQVPEYVGTLSSAASTGGSIIEIESLLFDNDTKRITAWVTGERTGQELSSDRPMLDQLTGDGNSVYYSVQDVASESYIVPPTRLNASTSPAVPVVSAINLRVITLHGESATRTQPMIFWFDYTREVIESVVISLVNCAPSVTTALRTDENVIKTHRCFDVVAISKSGSAPYFTFFYALCSKDSNSNTIKARTKGWVRRVNVSNVMQAELSYADLIDVAPPGVSSGFVPWAMRGVVLEQAPEVTVVGGGNWTATMSIGIRVIARWYDQENPTGSNKLDGQLALGRVTVTGTAAGLSGSYTITRAGYKFIPHIGFQTNDDLSLVLPSAPNQRRFSGGPKTRRKLSTSVTNIDIPANTLPTTPPSWSSFPIQSFNSEWTVSVTLSDNSRQTYMCNLLNTSYFLLPGAVGRYELAPKSSLPFSGPEFSGINGRGDCFERVRRNYPRTVRKYPGDLEVEWNAVNTIPEPSRQVNLLDFDSASGNAGFSDGIYIGALIQMAGVTVATATICVNGGSIVAAAIENPLAGPAPGGYPFGAGTYKVSGFQVSAPGLGVVTLTGARIWNLTQDLVNPQPLGADVPDKTGLPPDTLNFYYVYGQEHCVHRWSVAHNASTDVVVLSSCAATQTTNPQGDVPFGASSPMRFNNFCEFYRYSNEAGINYISLVNFGGGISVGQLSCAVGGPWRLVGGLAQDNGKFYAAICPAGDDSQASTFLVRLGVDESVALSWPNGASSEPPPTASQVQYTGNKGLFVEAANMVRVTAPPLNVPSLSYTTRGLIMGAIRLGSSKGTQECFALEYEYLARNWRQLVRMSDYTFVNGGALSVYDGVNCNEACSFVWPQRDLTSISWSDGTTQTQYLSSDASLRPFQSFAQPMGSVLGVSAQYMLYNITRPYWLYEAGLNGIKNYGGESTQWGGDPSDNYEAIYNDGRTQQFSTANKAAYRGGPDLYGKHYYGRYQATPTDFGTGNKYPLWRPDGYLVPYSSASSYFLWAPRSAKGWSWQDVAQSGIKGNGESKYSQTETGGDFLMSWCYEYADGTGRISRSAPSSPIQFTVCAEIESTGGAIKSTEGKRRMGGFVTRFKWGFFVPRLELTNRSSSASTDPRRVTLQPYSTCEPYSTVMYRMPWDNFMNPINDFVVPRNATRGVVPYVAAPFQGTIDDNPCGYVVTNMAMSRKTSGPAGMAADLKPCNALFDGPTGDYMGMLREPYLYTTGGVLDNVTPPGCKAMCVHQNRLVIGGADDPTVVWFTKELTPTDAPGFNDLLTINIESGGAVTGLASMNSNLFIFKRNDVYVISGSMPDATGQSSSLSDPVRLPSGIGCIDHRSVLATPIGIFFQSTRSIELLTPDMRITPVGDKVLDMLATTPYVTSVSHNASAQEVYFLCHGSRVNRGTTTTPFQILVYSYLINAWYRWTLAGGNGMGAMTVVGETPYIGLQNSYEFVPQAHVYKQISNQYVDGRSGISDYNYVYPGAFFKTAKFSLNQVQGFQRVKRIRLLADIANTSPELPGVDVELTTDLNTTQSVSWTQAQVASINAQQGAVQLEVHVEKQKGQALAFQASLVAPNVVDPTTPRVRFSNLALVVGLKQGLNKRITEDAKK